MSEGLFLKIYQQQLPALRRFVARFIVRAEDVDDILQETFVRVSAKEIKNIDSPKAYLYRTARNIALNELNRKSHSITDYLNDLVNNDIPEDKTLVDDQVYRKIQLEVFVRAVSDLPPQCRQIFVLRKIYGLTHKEISGRLDISSAAIEKHITRGLARCKAYMAHEGYTMQSLKVVDAQPMKGVKHLV